MKTFSIDGENNITVHASRQEGYVTARENGAGVFGSEDELLNLTDSKRLVAIWNSLTGVTPVKKFMSTKAGARRIFAQLQKLEPEEVATEVAEAEAKPAKVKKAEAEAEAKPAKVKKAKAAKAAAAPANGTGPRESSKQAQVLAMLKRPGGATLEEISKDMGWQIHTTRSLMSAGGDYAKKWGITVLSEKVGETRTYRVA